MYAGPTAWQQLGLGRPPDDRPLCVGKAEESLGRATCERTSYRQDGAIVASAFVCRATRRRSRTGSNSLAGDLQPQSWAEQMADPLLE